MFSQVIHAMFTGRLVLFTAMLGFDFILHSNVVPIILSYLCIVYCVCVCHEVFLGCNNQVEKLGPKPRRR